MGENGVFVFPDAASKAAGMDPGLLALMQNNGGFGGNNAWWLIFLWMMWASNGNGWGNGFGGGNNGYLANQIANNEGRDLLLQAINGRADALGQLAQITNSSVETVKSNLFTLQSAIQSVGSQVGMSGLQVINAIQAGDASLASQLAQCCCENRLATCQQTNTLQSAIAAHDSNVRLQLAQNEAADQLSVCQQTNTLATQGERNTNNILSAIAAQTTAMTKEFCDLKERELQNKIDTQGDIITQLRNQISNDRQTLQFNAAFHALDDKVDAIAAKQPNTVPVQWPNIIAANATPQIGQAYYPGYGYGYGYGNGFGGGIVF